MQSRQEIRSIIRLNPEARIVVTGCHAQTEPEQIKKIETVHHIAGHTDKFSIAKAIIEWDAAAGAGSPALPFSDPSPVPSSRFLSFKPAVFGEKTRAYLKIQDGCNAFCTYCIVPYARGRSASMPADDVLEHLKHLDNAGFKEAIISGIHLGAYGLDFEEPSSLSSLVKKIAALKPIHRIRLSSIEPKELTDDLLALVRSNPMICDHFHIPVQSGDDLILKRMKRPYTVDYLRDLIFKIHNAMPTAAIGVDILQGFPGESEDAFYRTCELIRELPVSYLHVFPFSPRPGTPAFDFPDKVDPAAIKKRCQVIRKLGEKKRRQYRFPDQPGQNNLN